MKTETVTSKSLVDCLSQLKLHPQTFDDTAKALFSFNYEDYDELFDLDSRAVRDETYERIAVYSDNECVAILMLWGVDNQTAIHDHKNYDGQIKILKGSLTEVSYRENFNFIEYDGIATAKEGQLFPEEKGGIHSIINNAEGISVSLHIYRTAQLNLQGVRLFDTEFRKIAWLSDKAPSCSWNLNDESFEKIVKI